MTPWITDTDKMKPEILNWLAAVILTEPIKVTQESITYYVVNL